MIISFGGFTFARDLVEFPIERFYRKVVGVHINFMGVKSLLGQFRNLPGTFRNTHIKSL